MLCHKTSRNSDMTDFRSPVKIVGQLNPNVISTALHEAAARNDRRKIKKILKSGVPVDYQNNAGQTPLFCACLEAQENSVITLLKYGANPNERTQEGSTPIHAAAYGGNPHILCDLVQTGGDLRLHDNKGRTVRDWAHCQVDHKRRRKMLDYLEKTKVFAMCQSGQDILYGESKKSKKKDKTLSSGRRDPKVMTLNSTVKSLGYGKIFLDSHDYIGAMAAVPLVSETSLRHDDLGATFNNGPFNVMESMQWNKSLVTVKRLHKEPPDGGIVDLLITEYEFMAKLRHPNILLLMGVCQTNMLDGLVLLYERVSCGSLYTRLYQRVEHIPSRTMCEILKQITEAVIYLHQQNLLHCAITSHAVQMVSPIIAKLGNFEYMVENVYNDGRGPKSSVTENTYLNAVYNWMAPEVIDNESPTEKSDMYSVCSLLWELLHGMPPWSGMQADDIKSKLVGDHISVEIRDRVQAPYRELLQYGLSVEPKKRQLTMEQIRDIMIKIIIGQDVMSDNDTTRSPRPYKTWRFTSHEQDDLSSCDEDAEEAREISEVYKAQKLRESTTNTDSTQHNKLYDTVVHASGDKRTRSQSEASAATAEEDIITQERDVYKLKSSMAPLSSERSTLSAGNDHHTSAATSPGKVSDKPLRFSFMADNAKREFMQSTPTSAALASEPATIPKPESEDGSETQSSEYHSSHSGSSGKSYCTDPSNPFKKCHVSHREIENLKHIPPPPPVMTSGGSSVTLLTKNDSDLQKRRPTVYGTLLKQFSGSAVANKVASKGRIHYGDFSFTDVKNQLPEAKSSAISTESTEKSYGSYRSKTSLTSENIDETNAVKPANHVSPTNVNKNPSVQHFAFSNKPSSENLLSPSSSNSFIVNNVQDADTPTRWAQSHAVLIPSLRGMRNPPLLQPAMPSKYRSEVSVLVDTDNSAIKQTRSQPITSDGSREKARTAPRTLSTPNTAVRLAAAHYSPPRSSPREHKKEWYGGRNINNLIKEFQGQLEEHVKKQSILCLKSKKPSSDTVDADTFHLDAKSPKKSIYKRLKEFTEGDVVSSMEGTTPVSLHMKDTETPAGKTHPSPLYRKPHTNDRKMSKSDKSLHERCPGKVKFVSQKTRSDTDQSDTDKEVAQIVKSTIRNAHNNLVKHYVHPGCHHKTNINDVLGSTSDSAVTPRSNSSRASSGGSVYGPVKPQRSGHCGISRSHTEIGASTSTPLKSCPAPSPSCSSVLSKVSSYETNHLTPSSLTSGRGMYEDISLPHRSESTMSQKTFSSGYEMLSGMTSAVKDIDSLSGSQKTSDMEVEDFYFDDILRPEVMQERHMRLQTTMPLDHVYDMERLNSQHSSHGSGATSMYGSSTQGSMPGTPATAVYQDLPVADTSYVTTRSGRKVKQCDSGDYTLYKDTDILEVEGMDPITPPSSGSKDSEEIQENGKDAAEQLSNYSSVHPTQHVFTSLTCVDEASSESEMYM